tara:strand:- start:296 stop:451 length:156 start_codon:yes stop_codon:yes gene_type:complete
VSCAFELLRQLLFCDSMVSDAMASGQKTLAGFKARRLDLAKRLNATGRCVI